MATRVISPKSDGGRSSTLNFKLGSASRQTEMTAEKRKPRVIALPVHEGPYCMIVLQLRWVRVLGRREKERRLTMETVFFLKHDHPLSVLVDLWHMQSSALTGVGIVAKWETPCLDEKSRSRAA